MLMLPLHPSSLCPLSFSLSFCLGIAMQCSLVSLTCIRYADGERKANRTPGALPFIHSFIPCFPFSLHAFFLFLPINLVLPSDSLPSPSPRPPPHSSVLLSAVPSWYNCFVTAAAAAAFVHELVSVSDRVPVCLALPCLQLLKCSCPAALISTELPHCLSLSSRVLFGLSFSPNARWCYCCCYLANRQTACAHDRQIPTGNRQEEHEGA